MIKPDNENAMKIMTERLLQFIWQFQYFNKAQLTSTDGEPVQVIFTGQYNLNQGPDFTDGKVKIAETIWAGTIELHLKTSDWDKHHHQHDPNYRNVILHVVWEDDGIKSNVPVLELKNRISSLLLDRYEELMNSHSFIPCEKSITVVKELTWKSWKDRLLAERLFRKSVIVESYHLQSNFHWEETFWWLLARNFGLKVNALAFEEMARSVSTNILAKCKTQIHQLEALLLGQAGLLQGRFEEAYPMMLQKEYQFLQHKYGLRPVAVPVYFLRMRPVNFPTVRLAQLATLIHESAHLFSRIKDTDAVKDIRGWLDITANDYWHYHYRLDDPSVYKIKKLGGEMIDNIIINTIAPVLFAYGSYHQQNKYKEKALQWLEQTKAEKNSITNGFQQLGIENRNAFDSQALLELKNEYCNKKRCLECGVGNAILSNKFN